MSQAQSLKTLNLHYRKKESQRVERDNLAFAKRLLERQSHFNKKALEDDFQRAQQYRRQILRVDPKKYLTNPRCHRKPAILPPLYNTPNATSTLGSQTQPNKLRKSPKAGKHHREPLDAQSPENPDALDVVGGAAPDEKKEEQHPAVDAQPTPEPAAPGPSKSDPNPNPNPNPNPAPAPAPVKAAQNEPQPTSNSNAPQEKSGASSSSPVEKAGKAEDKQNSPAIQKKKTETQNIVASIKQGK
jgi:hypothetical protein